MSSRILLLVILVFVHILTARAEGQLDQAFNLLEQTKTGKEELANARTQKIPIELGRVSKTDITATRALKGDHFEYVFLTRVIVDQEKGTVFQALDLAHELVHATHETSNPFDPTLDAASYVKHGIEGEGGEAEAIRKECAVGKELVDSKSTLQITAEAAQLIKVRCQFVWESESNPSRWTQSFYFLGHYYREFMKNVLDLNVSESAKQDWLSKIDRKAPIFSSAVAHKPYPVALLEEYVSITHDVCNRAHSSALSRSIASLSLLKQRCSSVGIEINP
jgi:hypothetical protein